MAPTDEPAKQSAARTEPIKSEEPKKTASAPTKPADAPKTDKPAQDSAAVAMKTAVLDVPGMT
jgi:hypothetical protein